jgi:hypothetical protein
MEADRLPPSGISDPVMATNDSQGCGMPLPTTARSTGGTAEPFIVALRRTANLGVSAKHPPQEWIRDNALPASIGQRGATSVM